MAGDDADADREVSTHNHDKLKGWTQGLRRANAAATHGLSLKQMKQKQSWAPLAAFQAGSNPAVEAALEGEGFRALQAESVLEYDAGVFRLEQAVLEMISAAEPRARETGLRGLHEAFDPQWQRSKSFKPHRKKMNGPLYNSEHGASLRREFAKFICKFIAPHVREHTRCTRIYFQSTPSLRIQPPSNFRIGYPHTDSMYFHQRGQINFWVPLTKVYDTNTLWLESAPGRQDYHPLELDIGQCARFYGNQCTHFTLANDTQDTRVSLDLRVVDSGTHLHCLCPLPCHGGRSPAPTCNRGPPSTGDTSCCHLSVWAPREPAKLS